MPRRTTTFPVTPRRLWEELTDPDALDDWFGYRVEWELTPGAPARFAGGDDGPRHGRVEEVAPLRRLRFSWWPEGDEAAASRVDYELEPDGAGTRLTVTETPEAVRAGLDGPAPVVDLVRWVPSHRCRGAAPRRLGAVRGLAA